jgi:hypothetical protein
MVSSSSMPSLSGEKGLGEIEKTGLRRRNIEEEGD